MTDPEIKELVEEIWKAMEEYQCSYCLHGACSDCCRNCPLLNPEPEDEEEDDSPCSYCLFPICDECPYAQQQKEVMRNE